MQRNSIKKCQNFIEHNADAGALPIPAPIPGCIPGRGPANAAGLMLTDEVEKGRARAEVPLAIQHPYINLDTPITFAHFCSINFH